MKYDSQIILEENVQVFELYETTLQIAFGMLYLFAKKQYILIYENIYAEGI